MIPVVIVDDEQLIRRLIINSIDWKGMGFEIVAEAKDGKEALEIIEKTKPKLIVMDINMPFINGIELSHMVHERFKDIKIIILTGYGEFEYAQKAIEAGVIQYILKPIDSLEFSRTLIGIKNEINKELNKNSYLCQLENEARVNNEVKKERLLTLVALGNERKAKTIKNEFDCYNIDLLTERLSAVVIEIDRLKQDWPQSRDKELWLFAVFNIAGEVFSEYKHAEVFRGIEDYIVCFFNEEQEEVQNGRIKIYQLCKKFVKLVKEYFEFTITIGIGDCHDGFENISLVMKEALSSLENKFFTGGNSVIGFVPSERKPSWEEILLFKDRENILASMRKGDMENVEKQLCSVLDAASSNRILKSHIHILANELINSALVFLLENNIEVTELVGEENDFATLIRTHETINDLKNWLITLFDKAIFISQAQKKPRPAYIMDKARNYIEANYMESELSLEKVASEIFVNPTYLSKIFKKELKCSLVEFIIRCRMKKAKELLDDYPPFQISEIAKRVGYSDPFYFSKSFKKFFGVSPSSYLESRFK